MYGMVNKGIEEMICRHHGEAVWEQVRTQAGMEVEVFISNEAYPDELTYRLVTAAAGILGRPVGEFLEDFGEHWVLHTARDGYGGLLDAAGGDLREFLLSLPDFHTRVGMIFPDLRPPGFRCTDLADRSLHLHYHTHRPGMTRFVLGLLRGLGKRFHTPTSIRLLEARDHGADHDVFLVEWESPNPPTGA